MFRYKNTITAIIVAVITVAITACVIACVPYRETPTSDDKGCRVEFRDFPGGVWRTCELVRLGKYGGSALVKCYDGYWSVTSNARFIGDCKL